MRQTNSWGKWIEKNWMVIEPEMQKVLRRTFKTPLYKGEFDDIIQEFVAYLLTRSDDTICDWIDHPEKFASHVYLIAHWCLNRGISMRATAARQREVNLDTAYDVEDSSEPDSSYEEALELIARCERILRKSNHNPRFFQIWGMWKEGIPFVEMAERLRVPTSTVNSTVKRMKDILREELKGEMNCQSIINMLMAA